MRYTFHNRQLSTIALLAAALGAVMTSETPPAGRGTFDGEVVDGWRWNEAAGAWQVDTSATRSQLAPMRAGLYDGEESQGWKWDAKTSQWEDANAAPAAASADDEIATLQAKLDKMKAARAPAPAAVVAKAPATDRTPAAGFAGVAGSGATSAAADIAAGRPVDAAAELTRAAEVIRQLTAALEAQRKITPVEVPPPPGIDRTILSPDVLGALGYEHVGDGSEFSPHNVRPILSKW